MRSPVYSITLRRGGMFSSANTPQRSIREREMRSRKAAPRGRSVAGGRTRFLIGRDSEAARELALSDASLDAHGHARNGLRLPGVPAYLLRSVTTSPSPLAFLSPFPLFLAAMHILLERDGPVGLDFAYRRFERNCPAKGRRGGLERRRYTEGAVPVSNEIARSAARRGGPRYWAGMLIWRRWEGPGLTGQFRRGAPRRCAGLSAISARRKWCR